MQTDVIPGQTKQTTYVLHEMLAAKNHQKQIVSNKVVRFSIRIRPAYMITDANGFIHLYFDKNPRKFEIEEYHNEVYVGYPVKYS